MLHHELCRQSALGVFSVTLAFLSTQNQIGVVVDAYNPRVEQDPGYELPEVFEMIMDDLAYLAHREVRTIDGTNNNLAKDRRLFGSAGMPLIKMCPARSDSIETLPSARHVSNVVCNDDANPAGIPNKMQTSDMIWQWGQFIDHDIVLTGHHETEKMDILIPTCDTYFDPGCKGDVVMGFSRSDYTLDEDGNRQVRNGITAFIDGSAVYGSDQERSDALRSFEGGKLATSDEEGLFMPYNDGNKPNIGDDPLANAPHPIKTFYLAGDVRANEQWGLLAMHTLWMREHNTLCDALISVHPDWDDEKLFQTARKIVGAEIQHITYEEFLPMILGFEAGLDFYGGYDDECDAGITDEFATAAYRMGHSLVSNKLMLMEESTSAQHDGEMPMPSYTMVSLKDAFFNPSEFPGCDDVLRGLSAQMCQNLDVFVNSDLRNLLFGDSPGAGHGGKGMDLAALNIQRGRDHGLGSYNDVREAYKLERVTSFDDITNDSGLAEKLRMVYGEVDKCDSWICMIAEKPMNTRSMVGETMREVLAEQFDRLRRCDRFWYQNQVYGLPHRVLRFVEAQTLADVMRRNTGIGWEMARHSMAEPFMFADEMVWGPH